MTVTGIIMALIIGLVIGALGRLVVPGKQNIPVWLTMLVGVVAALLGTVLARAFGVNTNSGGFINWAELAFQVVLAAIGVALVAGAGSRRRRLTR
ncbi:GlsB/YeaQ/YmgE family stress response membrane protein [Actinoplanes sp. NBRC 103695]|uniref:GlsB/YeaQ/YmgE family stress response membrane protein n=1 Tax=Actinoplanes sp. NBRC 103695 TaxID=3032202 RepID=UPI0024A2E975|nr:GlsB/YeaQ/YmgE family stress response membrane protein [Actinoplanes sp. NBRC 103695]GLZ00909.1 transglycosylase [Actinoplanes sp. NBRC 103695]